MLSEKLQRSLQKGLGFPRIVNRLLIRLKRLPPVKSMRAILRVVGFHALAQFFELRDKFTTGVDRRQHVFLTMDDEQGSLDLVDATEQIVSLIRFGNFIGRASQKADHELEEGSSRPRRAIGQRTRHGRVSLPLNMPNQPF